jgi:hypothetical protein
VVVVVTDEGSVEDVVVDVGVVVGVVVPTRAGLPLCRRREAYALRGYTIPAARRRASSSGPMPTSASNAAVSAPNAAPGA